MTDTVAAFTQKHAPKNRWPDLRVGWTVRVHQKLPKQEKGKASVFEGIVVAAKHGSEAGGSITVRRAAGGYGVEKVYPLRLPTIEKIEVVKRAKVRQAKLYYLREKTAREIRRKTRAQMAAAPAEETPETPTETAAE
ncbi:MAG TPA: 50S ribosomal protein L19 [Candidatus Paceibacterota bacterium]|nr:50S ribosomal protein L19 [Candidatus Paceibacterota bacterium]